MVYNWKDDLPDGVAIPENSDAPLATLAAFDGEVEAFSYSLRGGHRGLFEIDAHGVLSLKNALNYESSSSSKVRFPSDRMFTVEVRAHSDDGTRVQTRTFVLTLGDVNEFETSWRDGGSYNRSGRNLNENNDAGYRVAEFRATDGDNRNDITYSLTNVDSSTDANYFSIEDRNGGVGRLYLKSTLDYDDGHAAFYNVVVNANSTDGSATISQLYVLTLIDRGDANWETNGNPTNATLSENATVGAAVADFDATADAGNGTVTYGIRGRHRDDRYFQIDKDTGDLTTKREFTDENKNHYTVVVRAQADGGGDRIEQTFILSLAEENDFATTWRNGGSYNRTGRALNENNDAGYRVAEFRATDGDRVDITYSLSEDDAVYFSIEDRSGGVARLYLKSTLDFEDTNHTSPIYSVVVNATTTDGDSSKINAISQLYVLTLNDRNDNETAWETNGNPSSATVSENLAVDAQVADFGASDGDTGATVTYSLRGSYRDDKYFEIDSATGVLTTKREFTSETKDHYTVAVRARADDGGNRIEQTFILSLAEENDFETKWRNGGSYNRSGKNLNENNAPGYRVADFRATDGDRVDITYSLTNVDSSTDAALFSIEDRNGGVGRLYLKSTLDHDDSHGSIYNVLVNANSTDGSPTISQLYVLTLIDREDPNWQTNGNPTGTTVSENIDVGASVANFDATADAGGEVTYAIRGGYRDHSYFNIDDEGKLSLKKEFTNENKDHYTVVVRAQADDGGNRVEHTFVLTVTEVNDFATDWRDGSSYNRTGRNLNENNDAGYRVAEFRATDGDRVDITYSLTNVDSSTDAALFSIEDRSGGVGRLYLKDSLDFETKAVYSVFVNATTTDGDSSKTNAISQLYVLTLRDRDDKTEWNTGGNPTGVTALESISIGTSLGVVFSAIDEDITSGSTATITYGLRGSYRDDKYFSINEDSGVLSVKREFDFERKEHYTVQVRAGETGEGGGFRVEQTFVLSVVNVVDEFDAVWTNLPTGGRVNENDAVAGRRIGEYLATEGDAGTTIIYSLDTVNDENYFSIETRSNGRVRLYLKSNLDFEDTNHADGLYSIVLRADPDDASGRTNQLFVLTLTDRDDANWQANGNPNGNTISENAGVGISLADFNATDDDGDTVTYGITGGDKKYFEIDQANGVLSTKSDLNFEDKELYTVTVRARAGGSGDRAEQTFVLNIADINDSPEWVRQNQPLDRNRGHTPDGEQTATISEAVDGSTSNAVAGSQVAKYKAIDEDADNNTVQITYSTTGDDANYFTIDSNGRLFLKSSLNFEDTAHITPIYSVIITATSTAGDNTTANALTNLFVLTLQDKDDKTEWDTNGNPSSATVSRFANFDSALANFKAIDEDAGATITYGIRGRHRDDSYFQINKDNGALTLKKELDENKNLYTVVVRAGETGEGNGFSVAQEFVLNITDTNNTTDFIAGMNNTGNTISENNNFGTSTFDNQVADFNNAALGGGLRITYGLSGDNADYFERGLTNGRIFPKVSFDFESDYGQSIDNKYSVIVVASADVEGGAKTRLFVLTITDVNEAPEWLDGTYRIGRTNYNYSPDGGNLNENSSIGSEVARFSAADFDAGDSIDSYSLKTGNDVVYFSINADNGRLYTASSLDFETQEYYSVFVVATSSDTNAISQLFILSLNNINDNGSDWENNGNPNGNTISENNTIGTSIADFGATDGDGATVTYGLRGGHRDDDYFAIDSTTGVLTANSAFDFENKDRYTVVVRARSIDGSARIEQEFVLTITDVDNTRGWASGTPDGIALSENNIIGAEVYNINALNPAAGGGSITFGISGDHADYFNIGQSNGVISFASVLDFENPANDNNLYSVTIHSNATIDGNEITRTFVLTVTNLDNAFQWIENPASYGDNGIINENKNPATALATFEANDLEAGDLLASYSLDSTASDSTYFSINADNGRLYAISAFDHEHATHDNSYHVRIVAHATDGTTTINHDFRITIGNENEFETSWATGGNPNGNTISENLAIGTSLADFGATDLDEVAVTYGLRGSHRDDDYFVIDSATGVLTANSIFDFENKDHYTVVVRARSIDGSASINETFVLTITDIDNTTAFSAGSGGLAISENNSVGFAAGDRIDDFGNDGAGATITYGVSGGDADYFSIAAGTGWLFVTSSFDYENPGNATNQYSVFIIANADVEGTAISQLFILTITDVNEAPTWRDGNYNGGTYNQDGRTQNENNSIGSEVARFRATDADKDVDTTYSLSGTDEAYFSIDSRDGSQGRLYTASSLDFETKEYYSVVVVATSNDDSPTAISQLFILSISNVNEFTAEWENNGNPNGSTLAENNAIGEAIADFGATDGDGVAVTYSLRGSYRDHKYFEIDSDTGQLYAKSSFDFENKDHYTVEVRARSTDGGTSINQEFVLTITDLGDNLTWQSTNNGFSVSETNPLNIGPFVIFDATGANSETITYSIESGNDAGYFAIDSTTGALSSTVARINYEDPAGLAINNRYSLLVQATATTGNDFIKHIFILTVTDAADPTVWVETGTAAALTKSSIIAENNTAGGLITTFSARDDDNGTTITYSLLNFADSNYFSINANTGQIYALSSFDFEDPNHDNSYRVLIQADSSDGGALSGDFYLTITNDTSDDGGGGFLPLDPTPDQPVGINGKILFDGDTDTIGGIFDGIGNDGLAIIGKDLVATQYDSVSATNTDLVLNNIENFEQSFVGYTDADGNEQNHWFFVRDDAGDNTGHIVFDADGLDVNLDSLNNGGATTTPDQINLLAGLNFNNDGDFNKPDDLDLNLNGNQAASLTHDQFLALIGGSNNIDFI